MKKVLIVATVVKAHIMVFHLPMLKWLKENGYETYVCARNDYKKGENCIIPYCDNYFDLPFERSPFKRNNFKTYKQLKEIIDSNEFEIIHCHTPVGGALTRLAAMNVKENKSKVIYTAHGFHFYKGAPIINWLVYYPVERWLSKFTDVLITINKEDYSRARNFKAKSIKYLPGVGIDTNKFNILQVNYMEKRKELGFTNDSLIILSVGELNKNKNHETVIRALAKINNQNVHYLICGQGPLENYLEQLAITLGVSDRLHLLGFRNDVGEICKISDVFCFPSRREGLGLSALEAMACGLPIVTSNVHGIVDYSVNGRTGFSCNPNDIDQFTNAIELLLENKDLRFKIGQNNKSDVKKFDINNVKERMKEIYNEI